MNGYNPLQAHQGGFVVVDNNNLGFKKSLDA
jgi:hypothetical protein